MEERTEGKKINGFPEKITAIVLAAGRGRRMGSEIQKQYMKLAGRPLICYALAAFQKSAVDEIILVTGAGEEEFCRREIVEAYGFSKVTAIVPGGKERYHSVYEGLKAVAGSDYVLIHDGARPCVTEEIIQAAIDGARQYRACVIAMPVKDTIKVADEQGFALTTPDRSRLWMIQTPQAFAYRLVYDAYRRMLSEGGDLDGVTDDAMVVERMTGGKVRLVRGSYENIKVTTPEDLAVAESFLRKIGCRNEE